MVPDVVALFDRDQRTPALQRLLEAGRYRGEGTYREKGIDAVRHVVLCPQPSGPPLLAAFCGDLLDSQDHVPRGHLILVAADGAVVRVAEGNNLVSGVFRDVNQDGVIDRIETLRRETRSGGTITELTVRSMTEAQVPVLSVAFQPDDVEQPWSWRLVEPAGRPPRIELGPRAKASPGIEGNDELASVAATWTWHPQLHAWLGPAGAPDQDFVVVPPERAREARDEFAVNARRRSKRR